ncbi:MAG: hypothetical protein FWE77_01080 [Clostridia bacterium]|nr:hypothetical protein [Clostridia bacterium]
MKRTLSTLLILALCLCLASAVAAQAPAAGSLRAEKQTIRGNTSFTPASYPEIWLTPFSAQYIVEGRDSERYPANFLRFAPPEGTAPLRIESDSASLIDFNTLFQYSYEAVNRYAFELFLERAEEEHILADGADGVAVYVIPGNRRGRALIDLKEFFGGTSKLWIEIYDHTGDLSGEELGQLIQEEVARVQGGMELVELDRFWSQGVFASVELFSDFDKVTVTVDTSGMTLTRIRDDKLETYDLKDGGAYSTEISIGSLMWEDEVEDRELADGTPYKLRASEYSGHAFFFIQEGRYSDVYLVIRIGVSPEEFAAELERVFPLVTLPEAE